MNITLESAFELLQRCSAIIINDDVLIYPSLSQLTDDPTNEFMYLSWEVDGHEYYSYFSEQNNKHVTIHENYLVLTDNEGEDVSFKLLTTMELPSEE